MKFTRPQTKGGNMENFYTREGETRTKEEIAASIPAYIMEKDLKIEEYYLAKMKEIYESIEEKEAMTGKEIDMKKVSTRMMRKYRNKMN